MLFSTPGQFVVLALVFVAGWLFGLASHSGGRRWRDRYTAERDAHAAYRRDADARVAQAKADADARLAEANRRHADLERDHARLRDAAPAPVQPVTTSTVTASPATTATVSPASAARPAYPERTVYANRPKRNWFDWH